MFNVLYVHLMLNISDSWSLQGGRISMDNQIKNHWTTIIRLTYLIGKGSLVETKKYLKKCIYTVGMGNNDYINNYFLPKYYNTSSVYTPEQYAEALVEQYSRQLQVRHQYSLTQLQTLWFYTNIIKRKRNKTLTSSMDPQELYKSGARMFGVFAAGDSGCTPGMMAEFGMNSCVDEVNSAVMLFNSRLNMTLNDLNNRFDDAKFILIEGSREYPNDINVTDTPCCGGSSTSDKGQCAPNQVPCSNRQNYYFWDAFHPTERINVIAGKRAYEKLTSFEAFRTIALSKDKETGYISVA
ncbi:putative triacylglycerol lipase [Helianthus annuus]|nr:putative triacylglycerol lipase [Helianthus annuus]